MKSMCSDFLSGFQEYVFAALTFHVMEMDMSKCTAICITIHIYLIIRPNKTDYSYIEL
jgi:hypothetical protein